MIVEIARNVLRVEHADHAETNPTGTDLVITSLVCSLVGQQHPVAFTPGSRVRAMYSAPEAIEPYFCNYGLNPEFEPRLQAAGLHISARDAEGNARVAELPAHPFFIATLYVFQARDQTRGPHPITSAFISASAAGVRT